MDNTTRFSNRVEDYVKYRPGYPEAIVTYLEEHFSISPENSIADIGSGTGILSELFLKNGYTVTGIEPNSQMREKSVQLLLPYPSFKAVNGTAENTGLNDNSVDIITAAQAFHWFDRDKAKSEFERILKGRKLVVLIWNERLTESDFEKEYEQLIILHGKDYVKVDHRNINDHAIEQFFAPFRNSMATFSNQQVFNLQGLTGRLLSSSYMPSENEAGFNAMANDLEKLFEKYETNGMITIHYTTKVYAGRFV